MLNPIYKISNVKIKVKPFTVSGKRLLNSLHNIESYLKSRYKNGYKVGTNDQKSSGLFDVFKTKKPDFESKSSFS